MRPPFARVLAAVPALGIAVAPCRTAAAQSAADTSRLPYAAADVQFMAGMIVHHAQAVLIAGWAPTHGANASVRTLCDRIVVGQRDEIVTMQRWLRERGLSVPDADTAAHAMPGMNDSMLMPGMLTAAQLARLDSARGPEFDRLLLVFMIQHHQGAITMVEQLLDNPGGPRDGVVFRFASDVNADQSAEIDRMSRMLAAMSPGGRGP